MFSPSRLTEGVADVWVLWAVSAVALVWLSRWLRVRRPRLALRALARDERGASYTLSVVLVLPLYTVLVCLIVQTTLILVVKIGTLNAAYAAARSGAVFLPPARVSSDAADRAEREIRQAAILAMTPFASSDSKPAVVATARLDVQAEREYLAAYQLYAGDLALDNADDVLPRKRCYADFATDVQVVPRPGEVPSPSDRNVTVTVTYEMPLSIPGVARLLGGEQKFLPLARFFSRPVTSTVILEQELPQTRDRTLGINYGYTRI